MKRKRGTCSDSPAKPNKKTRCQKEISHPVLCRYYDNVLTLREYVLSRIASTSKRRRQLLGALGKNASARDGAKSSQPWQSQAKFLDAILLLDTVLVGVHDKRQLQDERENTESFDIYSQQLHAAGSAAARSQLGDQSVSLPELIDFSIWVLFNKRYPFTHKPPHMLCHGTLRAASARYNESEENCCNIPGLVQTFPNEHVNKLKGPEWKVVFHLMGKDADRIMLDLLLSCGCFMPIDKATGTYYQISGNTLSDLQPLQQDQGKSISKAQGSKLDSDSNAPGGAVRTLTDIRFVRSRMLYARAALNSKRDVAFGLRHIHVLNRFPNATCASNTAQIMKYVFPRQFGLHNAFISTPDPKETSHPFQDYTLREKEIARVEMTRKVKGLANSNQTTARHIPRRLRGRAFELIRRLQVRHGRCSYTKLLAHYCPLPDSISGLPPLRSQGTQIPKDTDVIDFMSLATSPAQVSAFCRAVVSNVFPLALFGQTSENRDVLFRGIDAFIKARRFESLTLHTVMHGMKISDVDWARPPHINKQQKMSLSDFHKRQEMFAELIYYIFDSFLIPLIRTNFHVTESGVHRNRLFYFRHDVWRRLTEPALRHLKLTMFDEIGSERALKSLGKRELGFSQIRLLPKEHGMRPITNLRRRAQMLQNGRKVLGRSINSSLAPAFSVLNYEKVHQPSRLGASLFSVGGMYDRLHTYRQTLAKRGAAGKKLYFVKVDVKGCFDSIPQKRMIELLRRLVSSHTYNITRHAEVKPAPFHDSLFAKPTRKFASEVHVGDEKRPLMKLLTEQGSPHRPNTVYVDSIVPQQMAGRRVLQLLGEHVESNIVRIGKKFYRQKRGIPQGSVVSSLLCNLFYGDLEFHHLGFLDAQTSVLFRLIDDFLLITTDETQARQFLDIMHTGIPSYGLSIKPEKSLVNFDVAVAGSRVSRLSNNSLFPYCGMLIDYRTLDISKDSATLKRGSVSDSLTVEYSKRPGHNFRRKVLGALKIQMQTMLLDTSHNARSTVLANLHRSMVEVALKSFSYLKCLLRGGGQQLSLNTITRTVSELEALAFAMLRSKRNKLRSPGYQCSVSKASVRWMTVSAFLTVFEQRQAKHGDLIAWLRSQLRVVQKKCRGETALLEKITTHRCKLQ